jgi:hypothetical protein
MYFSGNSLRIFEKYFSPILRGGWAGVEVITPQDAIFSALRMDGD